MFQIVTHNGQPRSQGGLFVGYVFPLNNGGLGSVPFGLLKPSPPPAKSPNAAGSPVTKALLQARRSFTFKDAYCPHCDHINGSRTNPIQLGENTCTSCEQPFDVRD